MITDTVIDQRLFLNVPTDSSELQACRTEILPTGSSDKSFLFCFWIWIDLWVLASLVKHTENKLGGDIKRCSHNGSYGDKS